MSLRDEIVSMLVSRPPVDTADEVPYATDTVDLTAAVRELQEAVVRLAEELDSRNGEPPV